MDSLILHTTTRLLMPVLLCFSVFLLFRGHNHPGGGFVAGLVAASSWALYAVAHSAAHARRAFGADPRLLIGIGLVTALASAFLGLLNQKPFFTGEWLYLHLGFKSAIPIGTPLLFDVGVYLTVIGVILTIIFALEEE